MQRMVVVCLVLLLVGCAQTAPTAVFPNDPITAVPELIWQFDAGGKLEAPAQVVGEHVVVATKTAVIALNASDGQEAWRVAPPHGVWPRSLTSSSDTIFVGVPSGLLALDANTGQERWQQTTTGEVLWPPLPGSPVYVATAFVGPGVEPRPNQHAWGYALDPDSGAILWSLETDTYTLITPTASDNRVVFGGSRLDESDVNEGGHLRLHLLTTDGTLLWAVDTVDGFLKSVALDEQQLYYLAYTDMVYGLSLADGSEVWHYPTENWSPGFTMADGTLYFGSDNARVHAVAAGEGTAVWQTPLEGIFNAPRSEPNIVGDYLYFQSNDNRLYGLNRQSGEIIWQSEPQPRSRIPLTVAGSQLYLATQDGVLLAYR